MNRAVLLVVMLLVFGGVSCPATEGVILLHGLCRTDRSMKKIEAALKEAGYVVLNVHYRSRTGTIEELALSTISAALADPMLADVEKVHFVTHSMGGILARQYFQTTKTDRLGRVVMLGPPNQGSEIVNKLGWLGLFRRIIGPAGQELGTDSFPTHLGPVNFELGVIAGDRSINLLTSPMIRGRDDGKVSIESTKVSGMKDHLVMHATHAFLMRKKDVIQETIAFLRQGHFSTDRHGDRVRSEPLNEPSGRTIAAR